MTTQVSKNLLDTVYVTAAGTEPMTGDLTVGDGTTGSNITARDTNGTDAKITFRRDNDTLAAEIYHDRNTNEIHFRRVNTAGDTSLTRMILTDNGNVSTSGALPTDVAHLTRKDYVDDNFVLKNENAASFTDADALVDTGVYSTDGAWTGSVFVGTSNNNQGILTHKRWNATYSTQTFAQIQDVTSIWNRIQDNGVWGAWVRNADRDYADALGDEASTISTIVRRDIAGDIHARLFRSEYDTTNADVGFIMTQVDTAANNYMRPTTQAQLITALNTTGGIDADTLGTKAASITAVNDTIVQRHSSGYVYANYFNTAPGADVTNAVTKVCVEIGDDGFIRHGTPAAIADFTKDAASVMANKTLTSPVLNTGVSGTAIDTTVTTSTTKIPHSNAVKTYVDDLYTTKNTIINGNFDIWQRGTYFNNAAETDTLLADRFKHFTSGLNYRDYQQSTDVPTIAQCGSNSSYSILSTVTAAQSSFFAGDYNYLEYSVEGYDYDKIAGGDATLSFWVKAFKTGIYCVAFRNEELNRTYVVEYTVDVSNTWEEKTITVPLTEPTGTWNTTNGIGLRVTFAFASGSSRSGATADTWQTHWYIETTAAVNACDSTSNDHYIARVQLVAGDASVPFVSELYADELIRCKRYYEKHLMDGTSGDMIAAGHLKASNQQEFIYNYEVEKRATPTVTTSQANYFGISSSSLNAVCTVVSPGNATEYNCRISSSTGSSGTAGQGATLQVFGTANDTSIEVDAEL